MGMNIYVRLHVLRLHECPMYERMYASACFCVHMFTRKHFCSNFKSALNWRFPSRSLKSKMAEVREGAEARGQPTARVEEGAGALVQPTASRPSTNYKYLCFCINTCCFPLSAKCLPIKGF